MYVITTVLLKPGQVCARRVPLPCQKHSMIHCLKITKSQTWFHIHISRWNVKRNCCLTLNEVHSNTRITHWVATDINHQFHLWVSILGAPALWALRLVRCIVVVPHPDLYSTWKYENSESDVITNTTPNPFENQQICCWTLKSRNYLASLIARVDVYFCQVLDMNRDLTKILWICFLGNQCWVDLSVHIVFHEQKRNYQDNNLDKLQSRWSVRLLEFHPIHGNCTN